MANPFKEKIQALREQALAWQQKKKSLIQQMETLNQADLAMRDRAQTINKLHQQWKGLAAQVSTKNFGSSSKLPLIKL